MPFFDMLMKIPGFGDLAEKAPETIGDFLNTLLKENIDNLDKGAGEIKMFYIMIPKPNSKEYTIAIVTADKNNRICRAVKTISLKDALQVIFNANHKS